MYPTTPGLKIIQLLKSMALYMKRFFILLFLLTLLPSIASAWWNEEWGYKKKISLDMPTLQKDGMTIPPDAFALIRLHTGNFTYFLDLADKGKDIRVLAGDELTPLKFYIEKIDTVNEMALIWVKLPKDIATMPEPAVWLYYGNETAVDGQDAPGSFDVSQVLTYQFGKGGVVDLTANANNPSEATATNAEGGMIGEAGVFNGSQIIRVPAKPSLLMAPATGWAFSTWLKIDQTQPDGVLFKRTGGTGSFTLAIKDLKPHLEVVDAADASHDFAAETALTAATWQHLAIVVTVAGTFPVKLPDLTSDITIGANEAGGRGFIGSLDQLSVFKVARDANAVKFDVKMQGSTSALIGYGEDATPDSEEGGENLIMGSLKSVTTDGWIIIGILGVMFLISWMVMIIKAIVLQRVHSANKKFEEAYSQLGTQEIADLNKEDDERDKDFDESPLLLSFSGDHSTYAGSTIYRIYHVGVEEMNRRLKKVESSGDQVLSAQSMNAVKATMDATLIRELQKLNSQMVLLTIAISGGPFLGLLGTVIGVMITFAAIAVSGEVNVNAIAPGIAGALTATVAGLIVAIPCLFGYNYLGGRIKDITADMHVFVDEFVAKLTEQHT
jgi:biopolymer transport protein ExbB